jgi:hypothetical protein
METSGLIPSGVAPNAIEWDVVKLYDTGTTSNAERHLWSKHSIKRPGSKVSTPKCNVMAGQVLGAKRQKLHDVPTTADAGVLFRQTLVQWMVKANIPSHGAGAPEFRRLIEVSSLGSNNIVDLVPTGDTLRTWIVHEFQQQKKEIRNQLQSRARSKIHLSFDIWTSEGNTLSLMAVVAHYLDKDFVNPTRLIALRRLLGPHSGANMAETLIDVMSDFGIADQLGYFMTDNAESNDTCLKRVMRKIHPDCTDDDVNGRRLRCWGHILNLVARSFLFGRDADAFELEDATKAALERGARTLECLVKERPGRETAQHHDVHPSFAAAQRVVQKRTPCRDRGRRAWIGETRIKSPRRCQRQRDQVELHLPDDSTST